MKNLDENAVKIADNLLRIKAVKLNPKTPFTWASGWHSPIYCDNRKTLSYPEIRSEICDEFVRVIKNEFGLPEVIAGVATGGIGIGALVADKLGLPFIYIRSSSKGHGLQNQIEGDLRKGQKVIVIEDLVSTGKSSLQAVEAIRKADGNVIGMVAIFTYGFEIAKQAFLSADCKLQTLTDYSVLIESAVKKSYIESDDIVALKKWRKTPDKWLPENPK